MWHWINQNASALSFFASVGTLLVWIFYAQLLFSGFRRQRKARILVNQGWGQQVDSVCLISNMSQEPVYIHCILLTIRTQQGDQEYTEEITDFDTAQPSDSNDRPQNVTRQGPLRAGEMLNLGTFRSLLRQAGKRHKMLSKAAEQPLRQLEVDNFKIAVIASYGPEGGVIGAQRKFIVNGDENQLMQPVATTTKRMRKNDARGSLENLLNPASHSGE